jgi:2',3'-cyclic-nucleotide 2'-phosphodiesterase (5'-nucleotidase family)
MNGMGLPAGAKDCVNLLYTDILTYQEIDTEGITRILQDIALEKPDITIALLHWGGREAPKITKSQTDIRDLMLAGGVDAIIGTHSAFVQQIEFDPQRGTVVAYSLGDLMGTANGGILLDLQITKNGKTGEVKLTGCDYVPVYLVDETETGGSMRLLRIREALLAYENRFVDRVSAATYEAMKSTLQTIESRVNKK